jgi:cob(I)alamin adenosyltransferase
VLVVLLHKSGGLSGTHINLSRAVCRRAERAVVLLIDEGQASQEIGRYLNRLSDFLFVASRFAAKAEGRAELIWRKA